MVRIEPRPGDASPRRQPRNYFSRREQYRLLLLVAALLGILWAIQKAPDFAKNFYALFDEPEATETVPDGESRDEPIDTRLEQPAEGPRLSPDVFEIPAEGQPPTQVLGGEYFPGVRADYLREVRDNMSLNRGAEYDALFHLLELLEETPLAELEAASQGEVGFVQLFRQPEEYRGKVVTVRGTLLRLNYEPTSPENTFGVEGYYLGWMRPAGGPDEPMAVTFGELPEGFPSGEEIEAEVAVTGFFYKRMPYEAGDGQLRSAPLVLAKRPVWTPPAPPVETPTPGLGLVLAIVGGTALLAIVVAGGVWYASRATSDQAKKYALTSRVSGEDIPVPSSEELLPPPAEALSRLARGEGEHEIGSEDTREENS